MRFKNEKDNQGRKGMGKITIQRIAKDLGLSRNTVSMALKGNELVTQRTREQVVQYARQVGYLGVPAGQPAVPETAREQESGQHRIMILRKPDVAVYWDKVINGISEEASRNHCQTQVAVVTQEDEDEKRLPVGLDDSIEAVFCVKMINREYIEEVRQRGVRIFLLDTYKDRWEEAPGDIVKIEGFQPMVKLTRHLISQGMRRIGFLNENSSLYETMNDRYSGYLYAMAQAGIVAEPDLVRPDMESDTFYATETFDRIVEEYGELPEAVMCGNDEIAKFLTQALRKKGIRVPEDVAVTGFDNDEEGMLDPFFSTVNVDAKWLGRRMVQCFLWRLENSDAPYEKIGISGQVVIRKSSRRQAGG